METSRKTLISFFRFKITTLWINMCIIRLVCRFLWIHNNFHCWSVVSTKYFSNLGIQDERLVQQNEDLVDGKPSPHPHFLRRGDRWGKNIYAKKYLTQKILYSGVLLGLALRFYQLDAFYIDMIAYPGELFMRLLKLMILPLVIASLIAGSASLNAKVGANLHLT